MNTKAVIIEGTVGGIQPGPATEEVGNEREVFIKCKFEGCTSNQMIDVSPKEDTGIRCYRCVLCKNQIKVPVGMGVFNF